MKLFGYYALHAIKNQIKKLFKTWIAIFIVACMVIGGLIGLGAGMLSDMASEPETAETTEAVSEDVAEKPADPAARMAGLELIVGGVVLAVLLFSVSRADRSGSEIFQAADVNLLFTSPLKPQSVLMFRLLSQLGLMIFASVYMLFQVPNLTMNLGLSVWSALALVVVWGFSLVFGQLLQMLLYTLGSVHPRVKACIRPGLVVLVALVAGSWFLFWQRSGQSAYQAALLFFNAEFTRWIPIWGWIKGFGMFAAEGRGAGVLWSLAALLASGAGLVWLIWHIPADFYEEAMTKSEQTAALLQEVQSGKGMGVKKRKKDRSERLTRDGLRHGAGANVFFHKALYNRFRFAHLGYFTKTTDTYLVVGIGMALLSKLVLQTQDLFAVALALGSFAFFRSLGNPLSEDTRMDYFVMIPESAWAKMFWSLLGGSVNCLLDLLPGMLAAVLILGANPLTALAWMLFIVSVDFYSTNVGAFIDFSVPVSAGKSIKQLVQILFIYFGLLPDVAIMAVALVLHYDIALFSVLCAAVNLGLGFLFFGLSPLFLDPRGSRRQGSNPVGMHSSKPSV